MGVTKLFLEKERLGSDAIKVKPICGGGLLRRLFDFAELFKELLGLSSCLGLGELFEQFCEQFPAFAVALLCQIIGGLDKQHRSHERFVTVGIY